MSRLVSLPALPAALAAIVVGFGVSGCKGEIGDVSGEASGAAGQGGGSGGSAGSTGTGGVGVAALPTALKPPDACQAPTAGTPGPRKIWRLSAPEFDASIRSIFSDASNGVPVATVFADPATLGFSIDANALLVQGLNASQLEDNAEAVATWAANNDKLSLFASCTTLDATCGAELVKGFGRRAFRTALADSDARVATYTSLFMTGTSFSDGAQAVISAMLQSPYFLYRSELGTQNGDKFTLTPYEVATELSYTLTSNTPDETLLSAADSVAAGNMTVATMIDQQAQRLVAAGTASNASAIMGFMNGWLGLPRLYTTAKDATIFVLTKTLEDEMAAESQNLLLEAFNGNGSFGSALTADHSFLNKDLATFYGLPTGNLGDTFVSVPYAGTTRDPGLLATGTFLNGYARPNADSPTQRGHMVRSRLLCQDIAPPPPNLDTTLKPSTQVETTRDHFINSHEVGVCASCHKMMDWIGFSFENYDEFGRYRTTDNGMPVVDTGTVFGDPQGHDVNVSGVSGPAGLSTYLAQSDDVNRCMLRYWTYYAYGSSSWAQDGCTYDAVYSETQKGSFGLKSALMAIIHAPNFTTRVQDQ
jgi:hypothetical protein